MRNHLFNTEKINYVNGDKPRVECILCAIRDGEPSVRNLTVARAEGFIVSVNLYPFNPAHLMIFPEKHITGPDEFSRGEALALHDLTIKSIQAIDSEFSPDGYNIGYNIGKSSGASIEHLHLHIVPRYCNEVGFLDIISGTRTVVIDPREVVKRLKARFE